MMKKTNAKRSLLIMACNILILSTGTTAIAMNNKLSEKKTIFDITSKIYADGKLIASPHIIARANQKAAIYIADQMKTKDNEMSMSGHSLQLKLLAKNAEVYKTNDDIKMTYDIQYRNANEKMHAASTIKLTPNRERVIDLSNNAHQYKIYMLAKRK